MARSKAIEFYDFKKGAFDFYRCDTCKGIFTYEYERVRMKRMSDSNNDNMWIHCRSLRYKPAWPHVWEWAYPSVLTYTIKLVFARGIHPWAEKKCPRLLPLIERLVSNELTR